MNYPLPSWRPRRQAALLLLLAVARPAAAQTGPAYFQLDATARQAAASPLARQLRQYQTYTLDLAGLRTALAGAKLRTAGAGLPLSLPQPDGTTQRFVVWEAPLLAPALAARYPDVHTYGGRGLDDPTARLSLTVSATGVQAQVLTERVTGAMYLKASRQLDALHYMGYYARDVQPAAGEAPGSCGVVMPPPPGLPGRPGQGPKLDGSRNTLSPLAVTLPLVVYRLVVNTTKEYTNGRTNAAVMADVAGNINDTRAILERDLAVSLTLVGTHFYSNTDPGGYDQTNNAQMLDQNRINSDTEYGVANYDIGHLLSGTTGGLASFGSVGNNALSPANGSSLGYTFKAGAVSPRFNFFNNVIAHEMGHQFAAGHTFNMSQCGVRSAFSAWEPGEGSTIMSYAGGSSCGNDAHLQAKTDPYYHAGTLAEMRNYIDNVVPTAGTRYDSGNTPPTISTPAPRTIPRGTPFHLTATGADADAADVLTYNWDELDLGSDVSLLAPQVANDNVPLFRSVVPSSDGATRSFPRLNSLGSSPATSPSLAERLPTVARTLTFRCTVRDNHLVAAGLPAAPYTSTGVVSGVVQSGNVVLTVSAANAQPFAVTAPNTAVRWVAGTTQTVTWNGAGTKSSAVNCQTLNVRLSTDGGLTYPTVLAAGVPNTDGPGTVSFTVPFLGTTAGRIMVEAADNYFFNVSDTNFTILTGPIATGLSPTSGPAGTLVTITGSNFGTSATGLAVTFGGAAGTITGAVTPTSLQVLVPGPAVTGAVVVTRTGTVAGSDSPGSFTVTPVVSSTSPTAGAEGSTVVIAGTGLGGATQVSFNGAVVKAINFLSTSYNTSPNTITLAVPTGATTGPVVVTTAGGVSNSSVSFTVTSFTFSALAVSPAMGAAAASEQASVAVTLNAPPNSSAAATSLKVSSRQAGGRRTGTTTVSGNVLTFAPVVSFRAGETVQFSLTTAITTGAGTALARPFVSEFTTRTRAGSPPAAHTEYAAGVGNQPAYIVAGNLNADPALDIVTVNEGSNLVSVLLNNGTGTGFAHAAGSPLAMGADPRHAVLADFNNDGSLDLLVACNSGIINVLKGNGDGTFTAQASLTGLGQLTMLAVGDLNGDGNLDLIAPVGSPTGGGVAVVALGNGSFGFATNSYAGLDRWPLAVALADLNEDGRLDLVVACRTGSVNVRLGDGAGSFTGSLSLPAAGAGDVVIADFTNDGHLDLASSNLYSVGSPMMAWVGNGDGTFGPGSVLTPNEYALRLATGDYNGDGRIDLIAPSSGTPTGGVNLFSYGASAPAGFGSPVSTANFGTYPRCVAVADLNNDQVLDFITDVSNGGPYISVALGTASGGPLPVVAAAAGASAQLLLYPNPAMATVTVQLSGRAEVAPVLVVNSLGQLVLSRPAPAVGQAVQLPLTGLAPGLYVVRCGALTRRLVVE